MDKVSFSSSTDKFNSYSTILSTNPMCLIIYVYFPKTNSSFRVYFQMHFKRALVVCPLFGLSFTINETIKQMKWPFRMQSYVDNVMRKCWYETRSTISLDFRVTSTWYKWFFHKIPHSKLSKEKIIFMNDSSTSLIKKQKKRNRRMNTESINPNHVAEHCERKPQDTRLCRAGKCVYSCLHLNICSVTSREKWACWWYHNGRWIDMTITLASLEFWWYFIWFFALNLELS